MVVKVDSAGQKLKPGPNVKGDRVFEAESPRDGSPLLEGLCIDVNVEGPAGMILSGVSRTGRFEVGGKLENHCTQPAHEHKT